MAAAPVSAINGDPRIWGSKGPHKTLDITRDAKFDVESNVMVHLSSNSSLGCVLGPFTAKVNVFVPPAYTTSLLP